MNGEKVLPRCAISTVRRAVSTAESMSFAVAVAFPWNDPNDLAGATQATSARRTQIGARRIGQRLPARAKWQTCAPRYPTGPSGAACVTLIVSAAVTGR